ncbi:MAG: nucleoside-diphosphate sugar epimerase/dehydratase [Veillonella sp.]|uniref:polysaccharide biosynthesis protein n=1 Tax=Veillonella sp. TaxID=1926307 RepID=UPI00266DCC89|nr:nucleoside-diphosphate sugar epimerase/dehydratase [Veillonella sp.]MDU1049316.1 nucleoside-diphosphate sugar epimerase/dehydratase [Veillonella sp.]MDU2206581.1 nucleoside-diphosphate sugar epimerase/dehydratase [Veillonella sp.]MDU3777110.1 nucleoside-diphosphate sugar epimerase/dehydratase [Veillonella sp.]
MRSYLLPGLLLIVDVITIIGVALISLLIRFDGYITSHYLHQMIDALPIMVISYIVMLLSMHLYTRIWRYAGMREMVAVLIATTLGAGLFYTGMYVFDKSLPRSIYLISWILSTGVIGIGRMVLHYIAMQYGGKQSTDADMVNTLIIGAGDAGATIAREIERYHKRSRKVIGFIDDDESKFNRLMGGVRILGNRHDIPSIVKENKVKEIIIAMPSVTRNEIRNIMEICSPLKCKVNTLPGMYQLLDDEVLVSHLHPVSIEDLLERDEVRLDMDIVEHYIRDKVVLVTGAGGSIGSEICRQIMRVGPKQLLLLGHGENSIYLINQELKNIYKDGPIIPIIADIRDKQQLDQIFTQYNPQVVFHAAAHKHVPLMEIQPMAAVLNNIYGTRNVADVAGRHGVERFVMISTDKAVNPTSVMGATKRVAEKVIISMNDTYDTKYITVRFGNVLGSRGSVIPLFKKQIEAGGPVTVTDPEMTRYFMTIPEASQLVLQAGAMGKGGEVFLLDMGEPVKIIDLARNMIRLSGLEPDKDIHIKITGLRPGEKKYEELLTSEEGTNRTNHTKIFEAALDTVDRDWLIEKISTFDSCETDMDVIGVLQDIIPTYTPNHNI